jgi:hypothetical protein
MKTCKLLTLIFLSIAISSVAQNEKKMKAHLKIFKSESFSNKATFTFNILPHDPVNLVQSFENAFAFIGLDILSQTAIINKIEMDEDQVKTDNSKTRKTSLTNTNYIKSQYLVTLNYFSGYNPAFYKIQCKDLKGQIVDLTQDSKIVATFSYHGNFDPEPISEAVAKLIKE